jgi:hypothetical protein
MNRKAPTTSSQQIVNKRIESDHDDIIYYNLTLNKGFDARDNTGFNTPAYFSEVNQLPFLYDSGNWYISLMRCTLPTANIPKYIFPIQVGINQTDINKAYNTFTFRYATAQGVYLDPPNLSDFQLTATFVSELLNPYPNTGAPFYSPTNSYFSIPKPPSANNGQQDVDGSYYFIYELNTLTTLYNTTLANLWATYIVAMANLGINLPAGIQPFYTFDVQSQLYTLNAEQSFFNQQDNRGNTIYPRVEVFVDGVTNFNCAVPTVHNAQPLEKWNNIPIVANDNERLTVINNNNTNIETFTIDNVDYTFLKMVANQSCIALLSSFQKILFEISGDISLKHNETDAVPLDFQQSTTSDYQKPQIAMLVDIEVDRINFATNPNFIQFQASSIEQVRLISLAHKATIQNFNLGIFWLDNYGNRRPLEIPSIGLPLTVKLAFFNKDLRKNL